MDVLLLHEILEKHGGLLADLRPDKLDTVINEIRTTAEARSRFKTGQLIWMKTEIHGGTGKFVSRVIGWDIFGEMVIARFIDGDPHLLDQVADEDSILPNELVDWVASSKFNPDIGCKFEWTEPGYEFEPGTKVGCVIEVAHAQPGDWIVRYQRPDREWLYRVVNESRMTKYA